MPSADLANVGQNMEDARKTRESYLVGFREVDTRSLLRGEYLRDLRSFGTDLMMASYVKHGITVNSNILVMERGDQLVVLEGGHRVAALQALRNAHPLEVKWHKVSVLVYRDMPAPLQIELSRGKLTPGIIVTL